MQILLVFGCLLTAVFYLIGWKRLHSPSRSLVPMWRAASFVLGLFLIWLAIGSPLAELDERLLTAHMLQHLLLMTMAPALLLLGAPFMPLLHGLPSRFVQGVLGPFFRWSPLQKFGRLLSHPVLCWLAAAAALVLWHIPEVFTIALRSEGWHVFEHGSFLAAGLLFWWPVIQPWPSVAVWSRWPIVLYLFMATLPCDILSGYLTFSGKVVYGFYLTADRPLGWSALRDQECAGALMWTCITILYLIAAGIFTVQLLEPRQGEGFRQRGSAPKELVALPPRSTQG